MAADTPAAPEASLRGPLASVGYCSGTGNYVVEQVCPQDQGVAASRDAGLDRQVQGAGGADGQADAGGQVADLGYQQPAGGGRVMLGQGDPPWSRPGVFAALPGH